MHTTTDLRQGSGLRALAQRHPVALFLLLAVGSAYVFSLIPILMAFDVLPGKDAAEALGVGLERAAAGILNLFVLGSALLVTALEGGRPAVRRLLRRVLRWRVGLVWWLVAVVALPLLTVTIAVLLGDAARMPSAAVLGQEVIGIVVAFVLVNSWEETAWAGFLQTRLERRHTFFVAAALTSIPFAAVHMPLQVVSGEARTATALAVNFTLLTVLAAVIRSFFGMVLRGAANSVLLVGLTHTFFNRSNNSDGIAADILRGDSRQAAALLATAVLTLGLGVILRAKLSRSYRLTLDEAEHRRDA